jgi:hypothetical protein
MDNTITSNTAANIGGGLSSCEDDVMNNSIEFNLAGAGGGISTCLRAITGNNICNNRALSAGGGIFRCHNRIENNLVSGNEAETGAGLFNCRADVRANTITLNIAALDGGGLFDCDGLVENNLVESNHAFGGGGLSFCGNMVRNNTVRFNSAERRGGGIVACNGQVLDNLVVGNTASEGAGFAACRGIMMNNTVRENTAEGKGGGFFLCEGSILENLVELNHAEDGGAFQACHGTIGRNRVQGNTAGFRGGGFQACNGLVENNLVLMNSADFGGAFQGCRATIRFNTIAANSTTSEGAGGGVHDCWEADVIGNIFWQNQDYAVWTSTELFKPDIVTQNLFHQNWDGIYVHHQYTVYADVKLIDDQVDIWFGNRQGDPLFRDPAGPDWQISQFEDNDFSLRSGSAALDLVSDGGPSLDILSMDRPLDGDGDVNGLAYRDAGAWEFLGVLILDPVVDTEWVAGNLVEIEWLSSLEWSGTAVVFELWHKGVKIRDLGVGWNPSGGGVFNLLLPPDLVTGEDYRLKVDSSWDAGIFAWSPAKIRIEGLDPSVGETAVTHWNIYE